MKPLDSQSHYETLEVPVDATPEEIERAYRVVRASYADDSLALYSVFDDADASAIRERIDLAYRVLSDRAAREEYDRTALGRGVEPAPPPPGEPEPVAARAIEAIEAFEDEDDGAEFGGARLRRARMRRGIEIDQIASITKINPTYLHFIEEESYDELPAAVYVRGFVTAYARAIGLDGPRVAGSYMLRMEDARQAQRPSRMLGRR